MKDLEPLFGKAQIPGYPFIIAGPCSAESHDQTLTTAMELAARGVKYFRAGLWKPRTKPGSFEGVGSRGLSWLTDVREQTGMIPITEIASASHLKLALRNGITSFWIGARTTANPFAVQDIADALKEYPESTRNGITILVKNPVNPDLELWIGALERIYSSGIRRIGSIHRGFSAYGEHVYRNIPQWKIPIELMRRIPNLPLICDPSHIGGKREFISILSQQAVDMNFSGLMIECHCNPAEALSDSQQQITPHRLSEIITGLKYRKGKTSADSLRIYREEIDRIDDEIISLLGRRMDVSREIGILKQKEGMPVIQPDRYNRLMARRVADGESIGLSKEFLKNILCTIHEESVRQQTELT